MATTPLSREPDERLYEMGRVVDLVGRACRGDRDAIDTFVNRPHSPLEGETLFDIARLSSRGTESAITVLRRAGTAIAS